MWATNPVTSITPNHQHYSVYVNDIKWLKNIFPEEELFYKSSLNKTKIYDFLRLISPCFNTIYFVGLNFILFIIIGILFYRKREILSLYVLSSLVSSIVGSFIFCIFSPIPASNYIHPALISTIIAVIGISVYIFSKKNKYVKDEHYG